MKGKVRQVLLGTLQARFESNRVRHGDLRWEQYRMLQQLGDCDTKTSSWVITPAEIRARGGALFCDRRDGHVFTYHNGAQSCCAARGFRGALRVRAD